MSPMTARSVSGEVCPLGGMFGWLGPPDPLTTTILTQHGFMESSVDSGPD